MVVEEEEEEAVVEVVVTQQQQKRKKRNQRKKKWTSVAVWLCLAPRKAVATTKTSYLQINAVKQNKKERKSQKACKFIVLLCLYSTRDCMSFLNMGSGRHLEYLRDPLVFYFSSFSTADSIISWHESGTNPAISSNRATTNCPRRTR